MSGYLFGIILCSSRMVVAVFLFDNFFEEGLMTCLVILCIVFFLLEFMPMHRGFVLIAFERSTCPFILVL